MKKPSTSTFIRLNPSKTGGALNVLYVYDRKKKPFPLKESVLISEWDDKSETVNLINQRAKEINKKKRDLETDLLYVAGSLMENGIEPYPDIVTQEYEKFLLGRKQKNNFKRGLKAVVHYELDEVESSLKELELQKQNILSQRKTIWREAEKYGFEIQNSNSEETAYFMLLLKEFVIEKAGCWIDATPEEKRLHNDGTKKGWRSWANNLISWTKSRFFSNLETVLSFKQLDKTIYESYGNYLMNPQGKHKMTDNSFGGQVKNCITFFNWVTYEKHVQIDNRYKKHWKRLSEEKLIINLSPSEIDLLWKEEVKPHLEKYRDLAVFGCLTSLRISDIKNTQGVVLDDNGFLRGRTQKTKGNYKIDTKLDGRIIEIGEKYEWNLNLCTEQTFNKQIKTILKSLFIKYNINQRKIKEPKYRWGKLIKDNDLKYKHELFSSHCCRRSWVTNMSTRGISDRVLMEMMGSTSLSEFNKYKAVKTIHIRNEVEKTAILQSK
ncbi:tyrosine-type recombinase/integrase [Adhaeribacter aquaticus]|uniref:tyrosine-type recombinase/integrase n=1 Tax=Adhaeribacter aquaticus TaxID=299567 RepID=UPI000409DE8E|nr:tyrosine-type recombinase/integrase [Adhaeribacter aquaticus]